MVTFGSLFSGIGGFDLGFEQAGMKCVWQCEIDNVARSVLAKHWPGVPCIEDVRDVTRDNVPAVDLVCGGFPCQDVSVAGKRAGLAGDRSGLWFEFHRVVEELRPKWVVVENVPGLLSSNGGADFAVIVRGLVECGYGVSWRVLDAQYFGVAQRRRRVFIVGSLGDGRSAQVLFEREGLFGHPPARRAQGQGTASDIAPSLAASGRGTERAGESRGQDPLVVEPISFDWQSSGSERTYIHDLPGRTRNLSASKTLAVAYNIQQNDGGQHKRKDRPDGGMYVKETDTALTVGSTDQTVLAFGGNNTSGAIEIAAAVNAHGGSGRMDFESETFVATFDPRNVTSKANRTRFEDCLPSQTLHEAGLSVVAFNTKQSFPDAVSGDVVGTLKTGGKPGKSGGTMGIAGASGVRRLTPTECERLQGFPDGHTSGQSDSARYRQLGNAVAVPVARWIGERIITL